MGVAGSFFEPQPSNVVKIHFFLSCKNAEIFVVIFQVVFNLATRLNMLFTPTLPGKATVEALLSNANHCVPGSCKWMVKMEPKLLVWIFILSCLS